MLPFPSVPLWLQFSHLSPYPIPYNSRSFSDNSGSFYHVSLSHFVALYSLSPLSLRRSYSTLTGLLTMIYLITLDLSLSPLTLEDGIPYNLSKLVKLTKDVRKFQPPRFLYSVLPLSSVLFVVAIFLFSVFLFSSSI